MRSQKRSSSSSGSGEKSSTSAFPSGAGRASGLLSRRAVSPQVTCPGKRVRLTVGVVPISAG